jgi:hypothetical protein
VLTLTARVVAAHVPDHGRASLIPVIAYRPVPPQVEQIAGAQVRPNPVQAGPCRSGHEAAALAGRLRTAAGRWRPGRGHRFLPRRAGGLPAGGHHPIGADQCREREPSRARSAGLRRCFSRAEARWA